jgi:UDP-N-acetylmuramate dehydrogenase
MIGSNGSSSATRQVSGRDLEASMGMVRNLGVEQAMESLGARAEEPMNRHTTLHVGGPAEWYLEAESMDDISVARIVARSRGLPVTILGNGSNLLVADRGIRGLVIKPSGMLATITEIGTGFIKVGSGVKLPELARYYREAGIGGLEWAFGVPGTVGGGIYMNAGTRDGEMKDLIETVIIAGRAGGLEELKPSACGFAYRTSRFQHTGEVIVAAVLRMPDQKFSRDKMKRALDDRKRTQPLDQPNCGSVFRNPHDDYAARLIEEAGLKGRQIGGAQISKKHANFIVNLGNAKATEVKSLIDLARSEVRSKFGIDLHPEVKMVGEWD